MPDQFDVTLEDAELLCEVELVTALMVAASESDAPMSQERIDEVLGIGGGQRNIFVPPSPRQG